MLHDKTHIHISMEEINNRYFPNRKDLIDNKDINNTSNINREIGLLLAKEFIEDIKKRLKQ
jgi:hypothetical protein